MTTTRFSKLFVVLFVLASSLAAAYRFDATTWPVVIAPSNSSLNRGDTAAISVQMNKSGTSATTVYLTSSHPSLVYVPASITVQTGNTSAVAYADVAPLPDEDGKAKAGKRLATTVRITATANGHSAYTDVSVQ